MQAYRTEGPIAPQCLILHPPRRSVEYTKLNISAGNLARRLDCLAHSLVDSKFHEHFITRPPVSVQGSFNFRLYFANEPAPTSRLKAFPARLLPTAKSPYPVREILSRRADAKP